MDLAIHIGPAHWAYFIGVIVILITMMFRANVVVPALIATIVVVFAWSGDIITSISSIFSASMVAAKELFNIFLIIALMTALLNSLKALGSDIKMVHPFRSVMKNGHISFFILGITTYLISLFFWPTPAVPLVAAVLLPAAIAAGMPPLAGAMVIAIAGQGMALSSDYIIGVAPGISAKAAGNVSAALVADRALLLSWVVGSVALTLSYLKIRKYIVPASDTLLSQWSLTPTGLSIAVEGASTFHKVEIAKGTAGVQELAKQKRVEKFSKLFAILTPIAFFCLILVMIAPNFIPGAPELKGGDAALLIGGVAAILMIMVTWSGTGFRQMLDTSAEHITDGFVFAFKAMGSVLPIAGFFFIGAAATAGPILGIPVDGKVPNLLFEMVQAAQNYIPDNQFLVGLGIMIVGIATGIDGSGFSSLPLTGTLAGALGPVSGIEVTGLAAIGQMGAVWTGGGTLIAWSSLVAVAGFAKVPVLEVVRALMIPVLTGLFASVIVGVLLWGS